MLDQAIDGSAPPKTAGGAVDPSLHSQTSTSTPWKTSTSMRQPDQGQRSDQTSFLPSPGQRQTSYQRSSGRIRARPTIPASASPRAPEPPQASQDCLT